MATGYTASVSDGKVSTLNDYAWNCARAFGALISMRDDPSDVAIPEKFEPQTKYHDTAIAVAQKTLTEVPAMSAADCDKEAQAEFDAAMASHLSYAANKSQTKQNYQDMISKVEAWKPDAEITGLKDFMLEQLRDSLKFDCGGNYKPELPIRLTSEVWREQALEKASRDLAYHSKNRAEEIQRVAGRNKWLAALRTSLGETP